MAQGAMKEMVKLPPMNRALKKLPHAEASSTEGGRAMMVMVAGTISTHRRCRRHAHSEVSFFSNWPASHESHHRLSPSCGSELYRL